MADIISNFKHPLPRATRKGGARGGGSTTGTGRNVKRDRVLGNSENRNFYKHPHAYRLNPKRWERLCKKVDSKQ